MNDAKTPHDTFTPPPDVGSADSRAPRKDLYTTETEIELRSLLRRLRCRRWLVLSLAMSGLAVGLFVASQLPERYAAEAQVMIEPRKENIVKIEAVLSGLPTDTETVQTQALVVTSRSLVDTLTALLTLDRDPEFNPILRSPSWPFDTEWSDPRSWLPAFVRQVFAHRSEPGSGEPQAAAAHAAVLRKVQRAITATVEGKSRVLKITFKSENPEKAALAANTLADLYVKSQVDAKYAATQNANTWLSGQLSELREQVLASERMLERYRSESGLLLGRDVNLTQQEVSELNSQLVVAQAKRAESEARLSQLEPLLGSPELAGAVAEVAQNPIVQRLHEHQIQLERKIMEIATYYADQSVRLKSAQAELEDVRRTMRREVAKVVQSVRAELSAARAREATLRKSFATRSAELAEVNKATVQLRALQQEADANRALFDTFLERAKQTGVDTSFQQPDASIISRATVTATPVFPSSRMVVFLGLTGGGLLGIASALILGAMDRVLRTRDDVSRHLGLRALTSVPAVRRFRSLSNWRGSNLRGLADSGFLESLRTLHTKLTLRDSSQPVRTILFTSSMPKEGKTTTAAAFAWTAALSGRRVAIIDCDLRRSAVHRQFGLRRRPGLAEYLRGEAPLEAVMPRHDNTGIYVIPAGKSLDNAAGLFNSDAMRHLLRTLSQTFDLIILDSPPVMAVSDALVLSQLVDATLLVVRWGRTPRDVAKAALSQFDQTTAMIAGAVLTMVNLKKQAEYEYSYPSMYKELRRYYGRTQS